MTKKKDRPDLGALMRGEHLQEPPDGTLRRAIALRSMLPQPAASGVAWLTRLLFDSSLQPATAGLRRAEGTERRLLWELRDDDADTTSQLDVRVRAADDGSVEVSGQLLPVPDGTRVEVRAGRTTRKTKLGEDGDFRAEGLPEDALTIVVRAGDRVLAEIDDVPRPGSPSES